MKKFAVFFNFLFLFAFSAQSKTLEQNLNVNIGIFNAASVNMTYSLDNKNYAFSSKVETAGVFSKLYHFNALYSTNGKIVNNKFIAQDYRYTSESSSNIRTKQLVFDNLGKLIERISSKNNKEKKIKITLPEINFDANDLQTVFATLASQISKNNFCAMEKEVFDGKKTYKISVKDEGKTTLNDKDVNYKGEALQCSIFIKRTNAEDDDLLFNSTAERPVYVWIGYKQKMPFVAKIEIDSTPLGRLKAYTTEVNVKD